MVFCNPMSCSNMGQQIFGGCSMFWIAAVILFFIIVLSRKWIAEPAGIPWSNFGSFGLGFVALFATGILTCSHKFALLAGVIGAFVGAYFGSYIDGSGGGGY